MMNEQSVYDELYGDYISGVTGGRADSRQIFENENRNGSIGVNNSLGSNLVPVSALPGYHQMVFKEFA